MSLHDELARLADDAPRVETDEIWPRARRARRRDRLFVVAATAAAVALLAGLAAWLPGDDELQPAETTGRVGVPDRLVAVPDHVASEESDEDGGFRHPDLVDTDIAIGRAAAAWITGDSLLVLVDAETGEYHVLNYPPVWGGAPDALALSPDGRRLAHGSDAGIDVVDLDDGARRTIDVARGVVDGLSWSPSGEWLAWSGYLSPRETPVFGRVGPDAANTAPARTGGRPLRAAADAGLAIDDAGTVTTFSATDVIQWPTLSTANLSVEPPDRAAANPDGSGVAVGSCCGASSVVIDPVTGEVTETALPGSRRQVTPLGWIDDRVRVLFVRRPRFEATGHLVLVGADREPREVATIEGGVSPGAHRGGWVDDRGSADGSQGGAGLAGLTDRAGGPGARRAGSPASRRCCGGPRLMEAGPATRRNPHTRAPRGPLRRWTGDRRVPHRVRSVRLPEPDATR